MIERFLIPELLLELDVAAFGQIAHSIYPMAAAPCPGRVAHPWRRPDFGADPRGFRGSGSCFVLVLER